MGIFMNIALLLTLTFSYYVHMIL